MTLNHICRPPSFSLSSFSRLLLFILTLSSEISITTLPPSFAQCRSQCSAFPKVLHNSGMWSFPYRYSLLWAERATAMVVLHNSFPWWKKYLDFFLLRRPWKKQRHMFLKMWRSPCNWSNFFKLWDGTEDELVAQPAEKQQFQWYMK